MKKILELLKKSRRTDTSLFIAIIRYGYIRLRYKLKLLLHQHVTIKGAQNITAPHNVEIGTSYVGFMHKQDITLLNIRGNLNIKGPYSIGRGCRIDIKEGATVTIGTGGYMNVFTKIIISEQLTIGNDCIISWNCQILDDDFHEITYTGKKEASSNHIHIGNNVWIGSNVSIYKGSVIPDGCVVAANSVVRGVFTQQNSLIGGLPAKVIREEISWQ